MSKSIFDNIPKPRADALPPRLKDLVVLHGNARLATCVPIPELLRNLFLHNDNNYFKCRMNEIMNKTPNFANETASRATRTDFRQFIRDLVNEESNNIMASLRALREAGQEKDYQTAIQNWAKFGFGTEQKVDINVGIEQKKTLVQSINDEYAYSQAIETEFVETEPASLPSDSSSEHSTEFDQDNPVPEPIVKKQKVKRMGLKERMKQFQEQHPDMNPDKIYELPTQEELEQ